LALFRLGPDSYLGDWPVPDATYPVLRSDAKLSTNTNEPADRQSSLRTCPRQILLELLRLAGMAVADEGLRVKCCLRRAAKLANPAQPGAWLHGAPGASMVKPDGDGGLGCTSGISWRDALALPGLHRMAECRDLSLDRRLKSQCDYPPDN
jgi:hypothetical protein